VRSFRCCRNLDDETLDRWVAYDNVGRLTNTRSGNEARLAIGEQVPLLYNGPYSHGIQYDKWGNMTYREGWGGENPSFTATYVNNKRVGLTYDAAGNLTNDGGYNFTYDVTGQQATASAPGDLLEQYYDGDGLRVKKKENNVPTYYLRSSVLGGQIVAEINGAGAWQRGYVYLGGELVAVQQGGVYWVHQDPLVKSKRVTDASGTVVSRVELDPWGGYTNRSSNYYFQPHTYNMYERDSNGADEAMFRRYNRWWSRFDQPDPYDGSYNLANPQAFNRYSYVHNDPVNFTDPSGLEECGRGDMCFIVIPGEPGLGGSRGGGTPFHRRDQPGEPGDPGGDSNGDPQKPKDALPFDNCNQFVDYLAGLAADSLKNITDSSAEYTSNAGAAASGLGRRMIRLAQFGYERHIHNKADGFRDELVKAGLGQPGGEQGPGVYGHILGQAGAFLDGLLGPFIGGVAVMKDYVDYLRGNPQAPSEIRGNVAGQAVGEHIWNFLSGNTPRELERLKNSLRDVLCK
jgi:RHS repeat-associated protein